MGATVPGVVVLGRTIMTYLSAQRPTSACSTSQYSSATRISSWCFWGDISLTASPWGVSQVIVVVMLLTMPYSGTSISPIIPAPEMLTQGKAMAGSCTLATPSRLTLSS